MLVYVMNDWVRSQLHEAIDSEGWDEAYKAEAHDAVDLWDDGPMISQDDDLSTEDLYSMFEDEDAPDPHAIGLIEFFGLQPPVVEAEERYMLLYVGQHGYAARSTDGYSSDRDALQLIADHRNAETIIKNQVKFGAKGWTVINVKDVRS